MTFCCCCVLLYLAFLLGLANTLKMAIVALVISLILGVIFGLMATSGKKGLETISRIYVELIQNTPLILQLCFLYYGLAFSGNSLGILTTGMLALGIYHGAYMAEVIRAGIGAIDKGQFEAASSQGFSYIGKMYPRLLRFLTIYIIRYHLLSINTCIIYCIYIYVDVDDLF